MKERKYPTKLFITGFVIGVILYRFYLFVPSIILIIVGFKIKICYYIGCVILLIDLILSFIWQIRIRNLVLNDNDNPDIQKFQDAFTEENPNDNLINTINEIIESSADDEDDDE